MTAMKKIPEWQGRDEDQVRSTSLIMGICLAGIIFIMVGLTIWNFLLSL